MGREDKIFTEQCPYSKIAIYVIEKLLGVFFFQLNYLFSLRKMLSIHKVTR